MPGVFSFLSVVCGIFSAISIYYHNTILFLIFLFSAILLATFQKRLFFRIVTIVLFVAALLTSFIQIRPFYLPQIPNNYTNKDITILATVSDFSKQTAKPNSFQISHILINGKEFSGLGKVYFLSEPPSPYSKVEIKGQIKKYPVDGFVQKLNRNEYFVYADNVKVIKSYWIFRALASMRERIKENSFLSMKSSEAMLFLSSICGISALGYNEKAPFIGTGTAHIFAVSGLHIGILGESFDKLFFPIGEGAPLASLFVLLLFVFLVGFRVSALRAFIMYGISMLAKFVGREQIPINTLAITASVILLFSPLALLSVSFQLSFAAIFALIVLSPLIYAKLPKGFMYKSISEVISVQLILFPIIAFYFNIFSFISFFANLVVIPLMYVLMPIGVVQLILSLWSLNTAKLFAPITNFAFYLLNKIVLFFSSIPGASLNVSFNIYFLLSYFVLLGFAIFSFWKNKRWKYFSALTLVLIFVLPFFMKPAFAIYPLSLEGEDGFLVVSGKTTVYLTSPTTLKSEESDLYAINTALKKYGINEIDLMVFDAPFNEKESSSAKLIGKMPVKHIIIPASNSAIEKAFLMLNENKSEIHVASVNSVITFGNMQFKFINGGWKNAILLSREGKKYLFVGKGVSSLSLPDYIDIAYAHNGSLNGVEFGKLCPY